MPVPAQTTLFNESTANGATTVFPYEFMIDAAGDITVELDGVVTTTGFTLTGVGEEGGGTIVFSTAPANGVVVLRYLDSELSRATDYQQLGDFNADTVDQDFDRLWLAMQSLALKLGLCVRAPISSASGVLPEPAANNVIGWNEDGTGFKNFAPVDNTLLAAELADSAGTSKVGFLQSGTGAVAVTTEDKLRSLSASPQEFDYPTSSFLTAFTLCVAAHPVVFLPPGEYIADNATFSTGMRIIGAGIGKTTIKWRDGSPESSLFNFSTASAIRVEFEHLTIDSNRQNQTDSAGYYGAIGFYCGAGSLLRCSNVEFKNGRIEDIILLGSSVATPVYLEIENCIFADGLIGTATRAAQCVACSENVDMLIVNNRLSVPSKPASYGRAGFVLQRQSASTNLYSGKVIATGNRFKNIGRGTSDTLGCIDVYSGADQVIIEWNRADTPIGRAFNAKSDSGSISICYNNVLGFDGLAASYAAIVIFNVADSYTTQIKRAASVCGNVIRGNVRSDNYGIVVDGADFGGVAALDNVNVSGNTIDTIGTSAILVRNTKQTFIGQNVISGGASAGVAATGIVGQLLIAGNSINGCISNAVQLNSGMTACDITIRGNDIYNTTSRAINIDTCNSYVIDGNTIDGALYAYYTNGSTEESKIGGNTLRAVTNLWNKTGTDSKLEYVGDRTSTAMPFATRTVTIATGAISVFADFHYVDTEASAATDDLDTINGGYDGRRLVLFAANNARDVVLKDGTGNLHLVGDFTVTHSDDSIELISRGGQWYELGRSDNAV